MWVDNNTRQRLNKECAELEASVLARLDAANVKPNEEKELDGVRCIISVCWADQSTREIGSTYYRLYVKVEVGFGRTKLFYKKKIGQINDVDVPTMIEHIKKEVASTKEKRAADSENRDEWEQKQAFVKETLRTLGVPESSPFLADTDTVRELAAYGNDTFTLKLHKLSKDQFTAAVEALVKVGVIA